jgi:hypothetical protein
MILALSGFMWQSVVVSIHYFGYKTTTAVTFVIRDKIKPQVTAICVRYRDVIDHERLFYETGIRVKSDPSNASLTSVALREKDDATEKLTIEQIFNYTPDPDQVIKRCLVPDDYGTVSRETSDCKPHFMVDKFFTQINVCYRFMRKRKDDYPIEMITHSGTKSYLIYLVVLSDHFWNIAYVSAIVYGDGYPTVSRDYGIRLGVRVEKGPDPNALNYFLLSAHDMDSIKLERPYDTKCIPGDSETYFECKKDCRLKLYATLNRVPGSEMLTEGYKLRPASEADRADKFMQDKMRSFDKKCKDDCFFDWCHWEYSVTSVTPSRYPNASFVFSVNTASQPDFHSRALPVMTFIEYFSFTMGCFGIWFGVSFASIDPRNIVREGRTRRRRGTFCIRCTCGRRAGT